MFLSLNIYKKAIIILRFIEHSRISLNIFGERLFRKINIANMRWSLRISMFLSSSLPFTQIINGKMLW